MNVIREQLKGGADFHEYYETGADRDVDGKSVDALPVHGGGVGAA